MKISKETFYWYLVIGLVIIVVILKFILDISISKKSLTIPKEYTAISQPINSDFDKNIIEELQKKKIINNIDLESIKTYKEIINSKKTIIKKNTAGSIPTATPLAGEINVVEASPSGISSE